jgi:hypothetical protein
MVSRYNGEVVINNSICNTKICTSCKLEKSKDEFSMDRSKKDGRYIWCKSCKYTHNQKTKDERVLKQKEYNSSSKIRIELVRLERRRKRLEFIWNLKDKPCADCGNRYHPYAMDFDHLDKFTKNRDVSQINRIEEIVEEAKKCDVVCSNCHRIRTFKVIEKDYLERIKSLKENTKI